MFNVSIQQNQSSNRPARVCIIFYQAITDLCANIPEDVMNNRRDLYLPLTHSSAFCWSINWEALRADICYAMGDSQTHF